LLPPLRECAISGVRAQNGISHNKMSIHEEHGLAVWSGAGL
jgi:hypothetical protein